MRIQVWALLLVLALVLWPQATQACSLVPASFEFYAPSAEIIALGTFTVSAEHVATFEVEQYFKGKMKAPSVLVMNHAVGSLGASCDVTVGPGFRFIEGSRALVFLAPDSTGSAAPWQPYGVMFDGVWLIENDQVSVLNPQSFEQELIELAAAELQIQKLTNVEPFDPDSRLVESAVPSATKLPLLPLVLLALALVVALVACVGWRRSQTTAQ